MKDKVRLLELSYIPAFFLIYYNSFYFVWIELLGIIAAGLTALAVAGTLLSLRAGAQNHRVMEGALIAGLFFSHLIPPWSAVVLFIAVLAVNDFKRISWFSYGFRAIAFPSLLLLLLVWGWNAYGVIIMAYVLSALALSYKYRVTLKPVTDTQET